MYDPAAHRWMTPDPIGFEGGDANLYRYVGNAPTNATDPSGLKKLTQQEAVEVYERMLNNPGREAEIAKQAGFSNEALFNPIMVGFARARADQGVKGHHVKKEGGGYKVTDPNLVDGLANLPVAVRGLEAEAKLPADKSVLELRQRVAQANDAAKNKFRVEQLAAEETRRRLAARAVSDFLLGDGMEGAKIDAGGQDYLYFKDMGPVPGERGKRYVALIRASEVPNPERRKYAKSVLSLPSRENVEDLNKFLQEPLTVLQPKRVEILNSDEKGFSKTPRDVYEKRLELARDKDDGEFWNEALDASSVIPFWGTAMKAERLLWKHEHGYEITLFECWELNASFALDVLSGSQALKAAEKGVRTLSQLRSLSNSKLLAQGEIGAAEQLLESPSGNKVVFDRKTRLASMNHLLEQKGSFCFAPGTPMLTPDGSKSVEEFVEGDLILSRDEHDPNAPVVARRVASVFIRVAAILLLVVRGRSIRTTAEHPFWVLDRGWTPAGQLQAGDMLTSHEGRFSRVDSVEDAGEVATVYNLEVEEDHTYFVGCQEWGFSIWAHNADACGIRPLDPKLPGDKLYTDLGYTHEVKFNRTTGGQGIHHTKNFQEAEQFALTQRNKLASFDSALTQTTPVKRGVPDRLAPNRAIPEEVQAWDAAQGLDAGKVVNGHQKMPIQGGPGDPIYASGNYEKWKYVTEIPLAGGAKRRVEIHYVKNADTGAIAHWKITSSQVIP